MRSAIRLCFLAIFWVVAALAAGAPVAGEPSAADARAALEGFDAVVNQAIRDFNVPGAAIAVVAGGERVYAEGFGYRDHENELPMTPDTLFAIGSTTKAMTATVLGMLVDEGKLEWDAPLRTYLPSFRLSDPLTTERITPRDLVTHRSGMPRHDLLWYNNNEGTREELIARLAHLELTEHLRARFQYNNLMFMTAGYLAGSLAGSTWEQVMRERLLDPLGMERTNFSVLDSQKDPDHALPHRETDDGGIESIPFRDIELIGPAGSVNSSVSEMACWLLFNLDDGRVGDRRLINSSTLAEIQSPQMTTGDIPARPDISARTYGMGWGIDTYRGHRRVSHGGGIDGFITSVMLFPDDGVGLVAFNNGQSGLSAQLTQAAADKVLGLEPIDWIGEALDERTKEQEADAEAEGTKEATRVAGTRPSHVLADYAGDYHHSGYGTLRIEQQDDSLLLHYNGMTASFGHWHYDVWNGDDTGDDDTFKDQKLNFRTNVDGQIAAVEARFEIRAEPISFLKTADPRLSDPAFLEGLVGIYETPTGEKARIELAGDGLTLSIPGQPTYTLEPNLSGRFVLKEARVVSIGFELDDNGRAIKALLYQPDGIREAPRVE